MSTYNDIVQGCLVVHDATLTDLQLWYHLVDNVLHCTISTQAGQWMSFIHRGAAEWALSIALQVFDYASFTNYSRKVMYHNAWKLQ